MWPNFTWILLRWPKNDNMKPSVDFQSLLLMEFDGQLNIYTVIET